MQGTDRLRQRGDSNSTISVEDTALLMQGFMPQRSFTAASSACIDSMLMVCGAPDQCYRQITDSSSIIAPPRRRACKPEAAQNTAAQ
jgi:hypothetical protein